MSPLRLRALRRSCGWFAPSPRALASPSPLCAAARGQPPIRWPFRGTPPSASAVRCWPSTPARALAAHLALESFSFARDLTATSCAPASAFLRLPARNHLPGILRQEGPAARNPQGPVPAAGRGAGQPLPADAVRAAGAEPGLPRGQHRTASSGAGRLRRAGFHPGAPGLPRGVKAAGPAVQKSDGHHHAGLWHQRPHLLQRFKPHLPLGAQNRDISIKASVLSTLRTSATTRRCGTSL